MATTNTAIQTHQRAPAFASSLCTGAGCLSSRYGGLRARYSVAFPSRNAAHYRHGRYGALVVAKAMSATKAAPLSTSSASADRSGLDAVVNVGAIAAAFAAVAAALASTGNPWEFYTTSVVADPIGTKVSPLLEASGCCCNLLSPAAA